MDGSNEAEGEDASFNEEGLIFQNRALRPYFVGAPNGGSGV